MVFIRKSAGRSGATKVQIAERRDGRNVILEHIGTARSDAELAVLMQRARQRLRPGQDALDLGLDDEGGAARPGVITGKTSAVLWQVLTQAYTALGFDAIGDPAFRELVLARIIEPTSKADTVRVLDEIGVPHASLRTMFRSLKRCAGKEYRDTLAAACFEHACAAGDLSLCLYDVTTLYFEAEKEDDLRKVGYSKERRVDPQIVVGLLVDRNGFPLEIGCYEGDQAETATIVPMVQQFADRHGLADIVVVADAGMLSAENLTKLDEANLRFIVGSRVVKAPGDLANHFQWRGDAFTDGQVIDTITPKKVSAAAKAENDPAQFAEPVWDRQDNPLSWRAVWAYSRKRAVRDSKTLTLQQQRAQAVVDGERAPKKPRFVKTIDGTTELDQSALQRAQRLVGLKGYVTNIPASTMPAAEVIAKYHDLWQVEASFRMSKTDLRARPIFHHDRDAIEAHLSIVFAALAISRHLQQQTGLSIRKIVRTLRPLQQITVRIAGHDVVAEDQLTPAAIEILDALHTDSK